MSSEIQRRGVPGIMVIAGLIAAYNLGYSTGVQVGKHKADTATEVVKAVAANQKEGKE